MHRRYWQAFVVVGFALVGCSENEPGTAPNSAPLESSPPAAAAARVSSDRARHERLALRVARALRDSGFRAAVHRAIGSSPYAEQKIHLQAFLKGNGGTEQRQLARLNNEPASALSADLAQGAVEAYLPIAEHRRRWRGDAGILVATAERDDDAPVAFDLMGTRSTLDRGIAPTTPVLMVGRAESGFHLIPTGIGCVFDCDGGGGGGSGPPPATGLYLTRTSFVDDFESWFKGKPEFEVHILGQAGSSAAMTTYQCAGENAAGPYFFNQDDLTWSGNLLLFSQTQLDQYKQQHAGQNLRVFVVEDDDTPCQIKIDSTRVTKLLGQLQLVYGELTGGKDSTNLSGKIFKKAPMLYRLIAAIAAFFATNDDPVGNAVEDPVVAGSFFSGANWVVKGENTATNGALKLEMR